MENVDLKNGDNKVISTVVSFLGWKEEQHKNIRGGKVMYDVTGYHKYLYEYELFGYWFKNIYT